MTSHRQDSHHVILKQCASAHSLNGGQRGLRMQPRGDLALATVEIRNLIRVARIVESAQLPMGFEHSRR